MEADKNNSTDKINVVNKKDVLTLLSDIKRSSCRVVKQLLPVMKELSNDDNEIVDEVVYCTQADIEEVNTWLRDKILTIVEDEKEIIKEIDEFITAYKQDKVDGLSEEYFLTKVWNGDIFDEQEVSAMESLLESLHSNLELDEDVLVQMAKEHFTNA